MERVSLPGYQDSIDYLYGLQKYGIKFGLNSTKDILTRVGDPHKELRCIHIAGTNGKGSTAAMISSILRRHGYRVGLYTSPHLVRFTERFRIDDQEVSPERILDVFERIRKVLDERQPPTFFEVVTAMGFLYFAEEKVDWAVIEVGMGGRLDATNVIIPKASVITNIAFDHQEYLGNTLAAIAREKAGIIKEGVPLVTAATQPVVQAIFKTSCLKSHSPLFRLGADFRVKRARDRTFDYHGIRRRLSALEIRLTGRHQLDNAAVALAALETLERDGSFSLNPSAVQAGLLQVRWPARLEVLQEKPMIILDGAHNPQGAESLREALKSCFSYKRLHLVLGIMADKDIEGILKRLLPLAETAIFTKPRYARAARADALQRLAGDYVKSHYVIPDASAAVEQAKKLAGPDDLICITGSLYFAGEIKEMFGEPVL